jgi:hypothetical protein
VADTWVGIPQRNALFGREAELVGRRQRVGNLAF